MLTGQFFSPTFARRVFKMPHPLCSPPLCFPPPWLSLTPPQDLDGPLRVAAQRKINAYRQQYADNQNISFLPAIVSTSCRMHGEFLRPIFLQAHLETEAHFTAAGMSSQNYQTDAFRFKRAAFLQSLKSKIGLAASKAAALSISRVVA